MKSTFRTLVAIAVGSLFLTTETSQAAIAIGLVDSFQGGTTEGWTHGNRGSGGTNAPAIFNNLGPIGPGDHAMGFSSTGGFGVASRFTAFTTSADWLGNYTAAGVKSIQLDVNNTGSNPINLRLAFDGPGGDFITQSSVINSGGGWQSVSFSVLPNDLIAVSGASSASGTMG